MYIADGHHRAASAYNVGKMRRDRAIESGVEVKGDEPFNYYMAIHFPASQLKIYDYNRVVKSLNGLTAEQFLEKISGPAFLEEIEEGESVRPRGKFNFSVYINKKWYSATFKDEYIEKKDPVR